MRKISVFHHLDSNFVVLKAIQKRLQFVIGMPNESREQADIYNKTQPHQYLDALLVTETGRNSVFNEAAHDEAFRALVSDILASDYLPAAQFEEQIEAAANFVEQSLLNRQLPNWDEFKPINTKRIACAA